MADIEIPEFNFSGFYYPQILENLTAYKRINVPELTSESPYDPFNQMMRMMALVGHLNNTLIDLVANESTLPTAKLTETVRNMLKLIDYDLATATPAQVDLVYELSKVFSASAEFAPINSSASTEGSATADPIYFELLSALNLTRTDQLSKVFASANGGVNYSEFTTQANAGTNWNPWASGPQMKDAIYFGHDSVMFDKLNLNVPTAQVNIHGVWEYYDGEFRKATPTSIAIAGGLQFDLTDYLGTSNRAGTKIRVQLNSTTAYEDVYSTWTGTENIASTSWLGQTSPSSNVADYTVGSDWSEFDGLDDGTAELTITGDSVAYTLPQTLLRNWAKGTVNGVEAYWIRYRVIYTVVTVTRPTLALARVDLGKQYVLGLGTQGRSTTEANFASSDGSANQEFETSREYYLDGTMTVEVDGVAWTEVDNFLASTATDKHFQVSLGKNDKASVVFGDGVTGLIPAIGAGNISCSYRYLANEDGNVGADTVTVNKSGVTYTNRVWNPRPGSGWTEAEGSTEESLEAAKITGPASLRAKTVAISPDDLERMTILFTDENGATPFSRALAIEEGYGPKTVELVVVAKGDALASTAQLDELEEYFNGDPYSHPVKEKHFVANQEVTAVNYTPKVINIVATVYGSFDLTAVENQLRTVFRPEALKEDGVSWEWEFGADVPTSRIIHEIFKTSEDIERVDLTTPATNVVLATRELPTIGTITITQIDV